MTAVTVVFVDPHGEEHEITASLGTSIMQAAVDNGIEGIVAECGGTCSCATCHCYIDDAWVAKLESPAVLERDMLACVLEPRSNSRLSCQIFLTRHLDGIRVSLPASQY